MKFRRTVSSVVISVVLVLAVLVCVLAFDFERTGKAKIQSMLQGLLPEGSNGLEIIYDNLDSTLMRRLRVNGVQVRGYGSTILEIQSAEFSINLWDLVKIALFRRMPDVDIAVEGVSVYVTDSTMSFVLPMLNRNVGEDGQDAESTDVTVTSSQAGMFSCMSADVSVRNLSLYVDYNGIVALSEGINATARLSRGLELESADLNIPKVEGTLSRPVSDSFRITDIRISVDSDLVAYASIESLSYGRMLSVTDASAMASLKSNVISTALFLRDTALAYSVEAAQVSSNLSGLRLSANYHTESGKADFDLALDNASAVSGSLEIDVDVLHIGAAGSFDGSENLSVELFMENLSGFHKDRVVELDGLGVEAGINLSTLNSLGKISVSRALASGLENFTMEKVLLTDGVVDLSYSSSLLGFRVRGDLGGRSTSNLVGDFSTTMDVSAQIRDLRSPDFADISLQNIRLAAIDGGASLNASLDTNGDIGVRISNGNVLSASFDYENETDQIDLRLYCTDLHPSRYDVLLNELLAGQTFIDNDSSIDVNMTLSVHVTELLSGWVDDIRKGLLSAYPSYDVFDSFDSGRLSLNSAVQNLKLGETRYSGAVSLETTVSDMMAQVGTLAITTGGLRLSYSGDIDFLEFIPVGTFAIQKAADGSVLASIDCSYAKGSKIYEFVMTSPLSAGTALSGTVNWQDVTRILADVDLVAPFFDKEGISFNMEVCPNPINVIVRGPQINLQAGMDSSRIVAMGSIADLSVNVSESMSIGVSSYLDISYDVNSNEYSIGLGRLLVKVSDMLRVCMDMDLTQNSLKISALRVGRGETEISFNGEMDFTFEGIARIIGGDTSSIRGTVDFSTSSGNSFARGSIVGDQGYLSMGHVDSSGDGFDLDVNLLGRRGNGFYGKLAASWSDDRTRRLDLNAVYKDGAFSLYDCSGQFGSLELSDMNLGVDISRMLLNASISFNNKKTLQTGENSSQSGTVTLKAQVQSLASSIFQLIAGLDYQLDFTVGLKDIKLSDGFSVANNEILMHMENGRLNLSSQMINGYYVFEDRYIDINIDKRLLFGLKVKGYLDPDGLDLIVREIHFPIPIANQFLDSPMIGFNEGVLEGDVMLKGPMNNPSLYGMLYCQSFEMHVFYLPNQIISLKNLAVSLQDHSIRVSKTPLAGYNDSDGRYFYGTAALEMIMQNGALENLELDLDVNDKTPVKLWVPQLIDANTEFDISGDVTGRVNIAVSGGKVKLTTDIEVSSALVDFKFDEPLPQWYYSQPQANLAFDMDMRLTTGHDIEFYYPEKDNSFINFTLSEGEHVRLMLSDGVFRTDGGFSLKTGQVYYFQNDFIITKGNVDLTERKFSSSSSFIPFVLNLTANITDYDSDGTKVEISLILQNSTLDSIVPRFSSVPAKTENEILAMLGQSVLSASSLDQNISLSSLAKLAATAADALTHVGVLESNNSYSLAGTIRNSLGLDIFSARSKILANVIIDALPGTLAGRGDISMLARYLDGTSIFAGKYIADNWFVKLRLMLKADNRNFLSNDFGHFLSKDLILDTEISLDWGTPMGTLSVFTKPHELSVFGFLDTIGFSVTKQIQF